MAVKTVTVLAPAYNEEEVIESFVTAAVMASTPDWEILIVDDGSEDRTPVLLEGLTARHEMLRVVTHTENLGLGRALQTGFGAATGDVVVTMDADLSHPFELIPQMVDAIGDADAVYASRYVPGGGMPGVPRHRVAISVIANSVLRAVFRVGVHDLTTGFRAFRRSILEGIELESDRFEAQLELTVRLARTGARFAEVPLLLRPRAAGESKMQYLRLIRRYSERVAGLLARR